MLSPGILHRVIVVGLVWNRKGELLFCKMKPDRGVFPGQWGFPGGGIEPGEQIVNALRRELREELGIQVGNIRPGIFKDGSYQKLLPGGILQPVYLIFLIFHCEATSDKIDLNDEFSEYQWVNVARFQDLDLHEETIDTLKRFKLWHNNRD